MAIRSNVKIQIGPVATTVSVDSGIARPVYDPTVCLGQPGHPEHAPTPRKMPAVCPHCGPIVDTTRTAKARKIGDSYHLLPPEEVAALSAEHSSPFKDPAFEPSPREQVEAATVPGDKLYYLSPTGLEGNYGNLVAMIRAHSELSFLGRWTPRSAVGVYSLEVRGDVLVMVERQMLSGLKPLPVIAAAPDAFEQMCVDAVAALTVDFDPAAYDNAHTIAVAEAFAASTQVAELVTTRTTTAKVAPPADMAAELQALIAASKKPATPARKAAAKQVAARRAPAKKTAA